MPRFALRRLSLDRFRSQLASVDAMPQLCLLGIFAGILTGSVMVLFRLLLKLGAWFFMPDGNPEAFEALPPPIRALLPLIAVCLIGVWLWPQPSRALKMGIGHVIERLAYQQGKMPLRNWINQWWVGVISVIGGLSAGREGPAIHLGSAASSWIGSRLRLPHNSLRVLVACGTAAGIAASFNTPIAGVIFAMEVVMMEYTIAGFMPVILASTMGALVSWAVYGAEPAFSVPPLQLSSLMDLPGIVLTALVVGLLAGGFVRLAQGHPAVTRLPFALRLALIGGLTALAAWWYPQVQGIGYDSIDRMLNASMTLDVLLALAVVKLALTAICMAGGVSVGIIGPLLVSGAATGALMGALGAMLWPSVVDTPALYAVLGMAAMMAAALQAPLAALLALLELTRNTEIMLPGMLAVVVAVMTARQLCGCQGFFMSHLAQQGLHPLQQPLMQALSRVAVPAVMERNLARTPRVIDHERAKSLLDAKPTWLIIMQDDKEKPPLAMKAANLARVLHDDAWLAEHPQIDLEEVPGQRLELAPVHLEATLSEAYDTLNESGVEALYVEHTTAPMIRKISGIITREAIENYYRRKR
ncbi:chloride channel protein [Salinicola sp. DM10]|uniref:chloride channel protein n=1 Tax=Salinicola sp. DM10 TaxID=2815721 RepID=UPI0004E60C37|nr:chloride channel protein [Salinicola sp. DM10]KFF49097.1 Cl- channel voltage-gated family protein [Gammaproteobacteria bacterium MFB021]MCE3027923.1 chloride channel protein [Salinicola sp. DM10]